MNTDGSVALKAFVHLRDILKTTSADLILPLGEAHEVSVILDEIFRNQGKKVNKKRSRPVNEDDGPSKLLRTLQSSSKAPQSAQHDDETISSFTSSSSTRNSQQPCTGFDDFGPPGLVYSSASSCQPSKETLPSVPSTGAKVALPSHFTSASSRPFNVHDLINALNALSAKITTALRDHELVAAATIPTDWNTEDPRVVDIKIGSALDRDEIVRIRRTLAERGLAEEYRQWRIHKYRRDIIKELIYNSRTKTREGTLEDFVKAHQGKFQDTRTVREGLNHGLKMLLLERLFTEPIISAILNFRHRDFLRVPRDQLHDLCAAIRESEWIMALVREHPGWLESCQAKYDACMGQSSQVKMPWKPLNAEERQSTSGNASIENGPTDIAIAESVSEIRCDSLDVAMDLPLQRTVQCPRGSTQNPTVEHSSQVCNVAPRSEDSRRHENLLGERECEIDIIPDYSALPALLSNNWTYVGQAQGENFAQQEGLYETYHSHIEETWSAPGLTDLDIGQLGPELGANDNAHASASTRSRDYLPEDMISQWVTPA